jgi:serine/threonine protein kinase
MVHAETVLVSMVGTPQYLAPEVVMQSRYRPGYENVVDSWAVGIIVYSMLTKALPFDDDESLSVTERIVQRYSKDFDRVALHARGVSELAIDFISRLIEPDASKRMSMQDALEHEWLAGPASLPSENPPSQSLGGDSMWNIEAFDSSHYMDTDGKPVSRWSSSGTSLDPSNDSFSQPMEGLRLDSRARVDFPLSPAQEADEDRNRMDMTTSPPPHVTPDTSMDEDAAPEPDSPPIEPIAIDTSTTLPAASVVLGNKRKQLSFASAECLDAPSVRTIRPATNGNGVGDVAEIGNGAENGDASSNGDGGRRILTRSKTANATTHANAAANEATPKKTPKTKQDDAPRVGPRKSRRIG